MPEEEATPMELETEFPAVVSEVAGVSGVATSDFESVDNTSQKKQELHGQESPVTLRSKWQKICCFLPLGGIPYCAQPCCFRGILNIPCHVQNPTRPVQLTPLHPTMQDLQVTAAHIQFASDMFHPPAHGLCTPHMECLELKIPRCRAKTLLQTHSTLSNGRVQPPSRTHSRLKYSSTKHLHLIGSRLCSNPSPRGTAIQIMNTDTRLNARCGNSFYCQCKCRQNGVDERNLELSTPIFV